MKEMCPISMTKETILFSLIMLAILFFTLDAKENNPNQKLADKLEKKEKQLRQKEEKLKQIEEQFKTI